MYEAHKLSYIEAQLHYHRLALVGVLPHSLYEWKIRLPQQSLEFYNPFLDFYWRVTKLPSMCTMKQLK